MIKKFFLLITCMFLVGCNSKEKQIDEFKEISYNVPSVFKKDDDYTFSKYYDYEENTCPVDGCFYRVCCQPWLCCQSVQRCPEESLGLYCR